MVTIPPEVVRIRASSTVFVNASSLVNLDFAGMIAIQVLQSLWQRLEQEVEGWAFRKMCVMKHAIEDVGALSIDTMKRLPVVQPRSQNRCISALNPLRGFICFGKHD